jgi:hypothetical protein
VNPTLMIGRETAGWDHTMDMRMNQKILPPSV